MSKAIKLYGDYRSSPSRAVFSFAAIVKINYEIWLLDLAKFEQKNLEYIAINPMGQVPAMDDNGHAAFESGAILQYLAKKPGVPDHWYPSDPLERLAIDSMMHWFHIRLRLNTSLYVFHKHLAPFVGKPYDDNMGNLCFNTLPGVLEQLEGQLTRHKYVAADKISIADIQCVCELGQMQVSDYDLTPYKHIQSWQKEVYNMEEIKKVHETIETIGNILAAKRAKDAEEALQKQDEEVENPETIEVEDGTIFELLKENSEKPDKSIYF